MTVLARVVSLLLLAAAIELAAPQEQAVVIYQAVPPEVVQIVVFEWKDNGAPREVEATVERKGGVARVRGPRGRVSADTKPPTVRRHSRGVSRSRSF